MKIPHDRLKALVVRIFTAAGCHQPEADRVAYHLVEANLVGHDSHGVLRIPSYVEWLRQGKVLANMDVRAIVENDVIAVVDGQHGLGQSLGGQAVQLGIEKSSRYGISVVALRNSGHLGRIGDWALMAARENKLSIHFVNTSGAGRLVAPFGGIDRRLSANPIAVGVPVEGDEPIVLDISTCTIAEGKIRVALNQGVPVPDGCIIDAQGEPTSDPRVFYADPPGAILSIAGHKGYGLGLITEVLAGALTGGGCTNPENASRVANGMLSIFIDPSSFIDNVAFDQEVKRFIEFVKSSRTAGPNGEILMPGEIEVRTRQRRVTEGIELDEITWKQIYETCRTLQIADGLPEPDGGAAERDFSGITLPGYGNE